MTDRWRESDHGFVIDKVSFVPDHVHIALSVHPKLSPSEAILKLMNGSQELMWDRFSNAVVKSAVERLWQPGAYVGSFGELSGKAIKAYMHRWASQESL